MLLADSMLRPCGCRGRIAAEGGSAADGEISAGGPMPRLLAEAS